MLGRSLPDSITINIPSDPSKSFEVNTTDLNEYINDIIVNMDIDDVNLFKEKFVDGDTIKTPDNLHRPKNVDWDVLKDYYNPLDHISYLKIRTIRDKSFNKYYCKYCRISGGHHSFKCNFNKFCMICNSNNHFTHEHTTKECLMKHKDCKMSDFNPRLRVNETKNCPFPFSHSSESNDYFMLGIILNIFSQLFSYIMYVNNIDDMSIIYKFKDDEKVFEENAERIKLEVLLVIINYLKTVKKYHFDSNKVLEMVFGKDYYSRLCMSSQTKVTTKPEPVKIEPVKIRVTPVLDEQDLLNMEEFDTPEDEEEKKFFLELERTNPSPVVFDTIFNGSPSNPEARGEVCYSPETYQVYDKAHILFIKLNYLFSNGTDNSQEIKRVSTVLDTIIN